MKTQKGITLVALIITIVVLLILAVVSINAIQNNGIIDKTQGVTEKYNQAQTNEYGTLGGYETMLNTYNPSTNVEKFSFTISGTTYYAEKGMTWGEWVESEYNVDDNKFVISGTNIQRAESAAASSSYGYIRDESATKVENTSEILENAIYSVSAVPKPVPH